jgi:uncharacterized membrane protein
MRSVFVYTCKRLKQMPPALFFLTGLCVLTPLLPFLFYIRGDSQVPLGLPKVLLLTICCAAVVCGFLRATWWSRPLVILYLIGAPIWAIFQNHAAYSIFDYLIWVVCIGVFVEILFLRRDVRDYYAKAHNPVA